MAKRTNSQAKSKFPVVGIGASAGGVAALQSLFKCIPAELDLAIVIVLHQMPDQPSHLVPLISRWTAMPVREAAHGAKLESNCIFVAAPGHSLALEKGSFATRQYHRDGPRPGIDTIDTFFESLARDLGPRAIAVVLSGTGADGAAGAVRIKQAGGMVLVQDPTSAGHGDMPAAAIANGGVDHVMPLSLLAQELAACAAPSYVRQSSGRSWAEDATQALDGMFELIRAKAGLDLTGYKTTPLLWRVQRRMETRRVPLFRDYEALLNDDPAELEALIRSIPIHVTAFFRDPPAWAALEQEVIPKLFREARATRIRAWTPACATGEEAYSVAMLLSEHASTLEKGADFQVFATDSSVEIIALASRGSFRPAVVESLALRRRQKFFYAADGRLRVKRSLREKMVFAPQDLLADPPFPSLDLVTCRNVLIYLEPDAARRVVSLLHESLRPGGYLFLGKGESLHWAARAFEEVAPGSRIYRKTGIASSLQVPFPKRPARLRAARSRRSTVDAHSHEAAVTAADVPSVIVDDQLQILRIHGDTGLFLRFKPGEPSLNLQQLLHLPIQLDQEAKKAFRGERAITVKHLPDPATGELTLRVRLTPLDTPEANCSRLLVSFLRGASAIEADDLATLATRSSPAADWSEMLRLSREELEASREELQALNEELRASNDQLNAANEELNQANARLSDKVDELQTQSDVLSSGAVMALFLDAELRMRWFTPTLRDLFPVQPVDVGRCVTDLVARFSDPGFFDDVQDVMGTGELREGEVRSFEGRWYLKRIRPFRNGRGEGTGVAITFMDITDRKSAEEIQNKVRITLAEDLDHARRLQKLSTVSLADEAGDGMYEEILDSGIALMQAQFGSLQLLDEEQGYLHLFASRNLHPDSAAFWRKVSMKRGTSSGSAFLRGERVVVSDVNDSALVKDLKARRQYALSGIAALQSTPLVTRSGRVLGVFSTHWRDRREPSERELALFDVVARQAADLIERRRTRDVLSDRDDRIRKLVELMPAGVCTCDAEGRLTFYNRRAMELWGREPNVGKEDKFCGSFRMWTPDGSLLRNEDCPMADAVLRGHSARNREIVIEQPTAARLVASMNVDPLRDREGRPAGAINVFVDITDRKRAEERLHESEAKLRSLSQLDRGAPGALLSRHQCASGPGSDR